MLTSFPTSGHFAWVLFQDEAKTTSFNENFTSVLKQIKTSWNPDNSNNNNNDNNNSNNNNNNNNNKDSYNDW